MSFLLDTFLIVICLAVIVLSAKRGFVRSLMGLISKLVALFVAYTFTPALANFIKTRFIMTPVVEKISTTLKSYVISNGEYDFSKLKEMPQTLSELLARYNVSPETVQSKVDQLQTTGDEALTSVARTIADPVVTVISTAAAFILIFVAACLVLWIVTAIVDSVFKRPVRRTANTVLGVVFGVAAAVLILFVYSSVMSSLITSLGSISTDWFGESVVDQTVIVKFFAKHDVLEVVQKIIS